MADKVEITNLLQKGQPEKEISRRYCIRASTISDIKKNSE
jgi:DNA-binding NarL/FixJ family response regulator